MACDDGNNGSGEGNGAFDPTDLPQGTATEGWGIGDQWYDYDFTDHKVSPRKIAWVVRHDAETVYFVRVRRYHGDDGRSATPSMLIHTWNGAAFDAPQEWKAEASMHDGAICLTLEDAASVDCDKNNYDILWRTDKRPVPELGFAPSNPSLYVHRSSGTEVFQLQQTTPPETLPTQENSISSKACAADQAPIPGSEVQPPATEDNPGEDSADEDNKDPRCNTLPWRIESALDDEAFPLVPLDAQMDGQSVFQLTSNLKLIQWSATVDDNNEALTIAARCVDAASETACTAPLDMPAKELTIDLNTADTWTYVSVCDVRAQLPEGEAPPCDMDDVPCVSNTQDSLRAGMWPDTRTFDLAVQATDDNIRVWVAPSQPRLIEDATLSDDAKAPRALWSLPGDEVCD